jgi:hypothetical protein
MFSSPLSLVPLSALIFPEVIIEVVEISDAGIKKGVSFQ